MTSEEIQERVTSAIELYREVTTDLLDTVDEDDMDEDDAECVVRAVFEAVCYEMGHVEGFTVLLGADGTERDRIRRVARRGGMVEALKNHDEGPCTGCPGSDVLRVELQDN